MRWSWLNVFLIFKRFPEFNNLDYSQADMRDMACEAVVGHREQAVTMQPVPA